MVCNTGVEGVWTCQCTDVTDMFCCALLLALGFLDVSFFAFFKLEGVRVENTGTDSAGHAFFFLRRIRGYT